ncbi:MAG: NADH-dependent [FeFe] hydrogenase, group A6 [bacterium]|nr:NADH-dependent [FeFe] hydrogenase, group A6 [bacterium]
MNQQVTLTIDGIKVTVPKDYTIMQAADSIGIHIPRLCYHPKLSAVGACRICVVEVAGMKNYPVSCNTLVAEGMMVQTNSAAIREARKVLLELLLDAHPKECQLCEKNQLCELQELAKDIGIKELRFEGDRLEFSQDTSSPALIRDPNKCILCGKCIRACSEIQGVNTLSFINRGFKTTVATAYQIPLAKTVCANCGQCVNFCPTGALTERDATEQVWNALSDPEKKVIVQIAPAVRVAIGEGFGLEPGVDMTKQTVTALRMLGFDVVFDTQFSADLTVVEEANELVQRICNKGKLPLITSCSPGWIKFCEHFHPRLLDHLSSCKSPQQMLGALIKTYYAQKIGIDPSKIFSVSIMPCTAKKYEASREEMNSSGFQDVDAVLTTRELINMIQQAGIQFTNLPESEFDNELGESTGAAPIFGATGGVMEAALRTAYELITQKNLDKVDFTVVRGFDGIKETELDIDGNKVRVAVAYGLLNAHRLLTEVEKENKSYHFIEIMACPGGCLGGGGQPIPRDTSKVMEKSIYAKRAEGLYTIDRNKPIRKAHLNPQILKLYAEFLEKPLSHKSHQLLHTHYQKRTPKGVAPKKPQTFSIT